MWNPSSNLCPGLRLASVCSLGELVYCMVISVVPECIIRMGPLYTCQNSQTGSMFHEARATIVGKATWKPLNLTPPTGKILSSIIISQEELPKYLKDKGLRMTIIYPFIFHAGPHAKQIHTLKDNNRLLPI